MNDYTREKIKLRMLKRIALLWDISDIEHIDPVVRLLIEALAEEIFRLSGELSELDDRLLSKLAASMTPVSRLTARPAHAIVSAMPVDSTVTIGRNTVFEYKETKALRKYNLNSIRFTPIVPFELIKASIRLIQIQSNLYGYDEEFRRTHIASMFTRDEVLNNTVWLGIEITPEIVTLETLPLYFDFPNIENKYAYLQLLPYTRWRVAGKEIECKAGLATENGDTATGYEYTQAQTDIVFSDLHALYNSHYITLQKIETGSKTNYPAEWTNYYPQEILGQLATPLLWIKGTFPPSVSKEVLEHLRVGINLFPVANISKRTNSQRMFDVSMFMPLETDINESFFEIASVKDSSGKEYELLSSDNYVDKNKTAGTYSLRRGGVEQYSNTNDTKSTILRLTDIIRDRNMFSSSKTEETFQLMLSDLLALTDKITHTIESLESPTEVKNYILVDKANPGETLLVDYWVTNGETINNFKPTAPLTVTGAYPVLKNAVFFTSLQGGAPTPSVEKTKDMHRYMLTTHDKLFTYHDILNFCRAEYGNYINNIEVKQGIAISKKPKQGLVKTIDLFLTLDSVQASGLQNEDFRMELLCKLEKRSPENFIYRIFITH